MMFILTGLLYCVFSVLEFYEKIVYMINMELQLQIWAIEIETDEICYDGLQAAKPQFVSCRRNSKHCKEMSYAEGF